MNEITERIMKERKKVERYINSFFVRRDRIF